MSADVVAVLTYRTWADGHAEDGHNRSGQAMVKGLVDDVALPLVTVVDPFRNWLKVLASPAAGRFQFPVGSGDECFDPGVGRVATRTDRTWCRPTEGWSVAYGPTLHPFRF